MCLKWRHFGKTLRNISIFIFTNRLHTPRDQYPIGLISISDRTSPPVSDRSLDRERFVFVRIITVPSRGGPTVGARADRKQQLIDVITEDRWRTESLNPNWFWSSAGNGSPEKIM